MGLCNDTFVCDGILDYSSYILWIFDIIAICVDFFFIRKEKQYLQDHNKRMMEVIFQRPSVLAQHSTQYPSPAILGYSSDIVLDGRSSMAHMSRMTIDAQAINRIIQNYGYYIMIFATFLLCIYFNYMSISIRNHQLRNFICHNNETVKDLELNFTSLIISSFFSY